VTAHPDRGDSQQHEESRRFTPLVPCRCQLAQSRPRKRLATPPHPNAADCQKALPEGLKKQAGGCELGSRDPGQWTQHHRGCNQCGPQERGRNTNSWTELLFHNSAEILPAGLPRLAVSLHSARCGPEGKKIPECGKPARYRAP